MWKLTRCLAAAGIAATGAFFVSATTATEAVASGKTAARPTIKNQFMGSKVNPKHSKLNSTHSKVNSTQPTPRKKGGHNRIMFPDSSKGRYISLDEARAGKGKGGLRIVTATNNTGQLVKMFKCEALKQRCPLGYQLNPQ